jgi:ABC-type transport system involved in cytochrome bd biosynthesis fused ATPase/permease subunit
MQRPGITIKEVSEVIEVVNLSEFLSLLPNGLNTALDPDGRRIPRSVADKIILARAIVCKPKLLMLEDPLEHVNVIDKEDIIRKINKKEAPWSIIITTVDHLWTKYIENLIIMEKGKVISNSFNSKK